MNTTAARRTALAAGVLSVAIVGVAGLASSALFTSTDSSAGNTFVAGTVVLDSGAGASVFTVSNTQLAPGTVEYGKVVVANEGTLGLRYAMTSTPTGDAALADRLTVVIVPTLASATCDASAISAGTSVYSGALSGARFGSNAAGAQTGDRALVASADEALCFAVTMPKGTAAQDNPFQGKSAGTTFTFDAEQTLNNA